ncbi:hypothetical protein SNEBB_002919 [Seison nebaliae]|nr:hypothetical protein SNEBB_002919 [Seison nebaliae]
MTSSLMKEKRKDFIKQCNIPPNEQIPPELHIRMCKKIAQLTKVIYTLNTKNEAHALELKMKENDFKNVVQEKLRNVHGRYQDKLDNMEKKIENQTTEIFNLHTELEQKAIEWNSKKNIDNVRNENITNLTEELEKKNREILILRSDIQKRWDHEENFQRTCDESLARSAEVEKNLKIEVSLLTKQFEKFKDKTSLNKLNHQNILDDNKKMIEKLKEENKENIENYDLLNTELTNKNASFLRQELEYKNQINQLKGEILDNENGKRKHNEIISNQNRELDQLKIKLEEERKKLERNIDELEEMKKSLANMKDDENIVDLKEYETLRKRYDDSFSIFNDKIYLLEQEIQQQKLKFTDLHTEKESLNRQLEDKNENYKNEMRILKQSKDKLEKEFRMKRSEVELELRNSLQDVEDQLKSMKKEKEKYENLLKMNEKGLNESKIQFSNLEEEYKTVVDKKTRLEEEEEELTKKFALAQKTIYELEEKEKVHLTEIEVLEGNIVQESEKFSELKTNLTSDIHQLTKQLTDLNMELNEKLGQQKKQYKKFEKESNEKLNGLNAKNLKLTNSINQMIMKHKEFMETNNLQIKKNDETHQLEISNLETEKQKQIQHLNEEHKRAMERMAKQLSDKEEMTKNKLKESKEEINRLKDDTSEIEKRYNKEIKDINKKIIEEKSNMEKKFNSQITTLKEEWIKKENKILEGNLITQKTLLSNAHDEYEKEKDRMLENYNQQLQTVKEEEKLSYSEKIEVMRLKHCQELEGILKNKEDCHRAEMKFSSNKITDLTSNMKLIEDKLNENRKELENTQKTLNEKNFLLQSLDCELSVEKQNYKKLIITTENDLKDLKKKLKIEFNSELSDLNQKHNKELSILQMQFDCQRCNMQDEIVRLNSHTEQLEQDYLNRPSLEKDLELISQLQADINERNEIILKINKEKEHFRMELINRDANFTKVFNNSTPMVGVLNPLISNKKKPKSLNRPR